MKPKLVLVVWRDAWFDFDEPEPENVRSDYMVTTVGFLVRRGPRFLSIAQEILPDGDGYRAVTHIPVTIVQSINSLDVGKELKDDQKKEAGSGGKSELERTPRLSGRRFNDPKP